MKIDVISCPHCGSKGEAVNEEYRPDPEEGPGLGFSTFGVHVKCTRCGARGPVVEYKFRGDETERTREAISLWNRRSDQNDSQTVKFEDGKLEPGEEPATERQISFAEKIAGKFGLELPKRRSKKEYWAFISKHRAKWDALFRRPTNVPEDDWPDDCPIDMFELC